MPSAPPPPPGRLPAWFWFATGAAAVAFVVFLDSLPPPSLNLPPPAAVEPVAEPEPVAESEPVAEPEPAPAVERAPPPSSAPPTVAEPAPPSPPRSRKSVQADLDKIAQSAVRALLVLEQTAIMRPDEMIADPVRARDRSCSAVRSFLRSMDTVFFRLDNLRPDAARVGLAASLDATKAGFARSPMVANADLLLADCP